MYTNYKLWFMSLRTMCICLEELECTRLNTIDLSSHHIYWTISILWVMIIFSKLYEPVLNTNWGDHTWFCGCHFLVKVFACCFDACHMPLYRSVYMDGHVGLENDWCKCWTSGEKDAYADFTVGMRNCWEAQEGTCCVLSVHWKRLFWVDGG